MSCSFPDRDADTGLAEMSRAISVLPPTLAATSASVLLSLLTMMHNARVALHSLLLGGGSRRKRDVGHHIYKRAVANDGSLTVTQVRR